MHSIADNYKFEFDGITEHANEYKTDLSIYEPWVEKVKANAKKLSDFVYEFKDGSRVFIAKYKTKYQCTVCH